MAVDALQSIRGFNSGPPEWLIEHWQEEDPTVNGSTQVGDQTFGGDLRHPHTVSGLEAYGMHVVPDAQALRKF